MQCATRETNMAQTSENQYAAQRRATHDAPDSELSVTGSRPLGVEISDYYMYSYMY